MTRLLLMEGNTAEKCARAHELGVRTSSEIYIEAIAAHYPEIALEDLKEIVQDLSDVAVVEVSPQMEGRTMLVVLVPAKAAPKKKEKSEQAEVKSEAAA